MTDHKVKVCYIYDKKLIQEADRLPAVKGRASLVHNLIAAYNLLEHVTTVHSSSASYEALKDFHSEIYLDHLKSFTDVDEEYITIKQDEDFGIGYDCPPVSNMYDLISTIAGGSITAARCLVLGLAEVSINWCGGWHHAQRFTAEGFCYVNDIVLAINTLKKTFSKVLYIDLDVHHGNGVQDAFNLSKSVLTLSFHKYEPGFYPGTGGVEEIGTLAGKGYTCNVPLQASYSDETLNYMFEKVFEKIHGVFEPEAIVVQCGADALALDPHGGASLTIQGYCRCLRRVLDKRKPTLLLGGGGYAFPNAARLWTSITALVIGIELDQDIPEHENWPSYGPDFTLNIQPTLVRDPNQKLNLDDCLSTILSNLNNLVEAQSKTLVKQTKTIENRVNKKNKCCKENKPNYKVEIDLSSNTEDVYCFLED